MQRLAVRQTPVFLNTYVSNADKHYRTRAITGLARLRTDEGSKALDRVTRDDKVAPDVRAAADKALKQLKKR
jgi:hypothetical protein